MGSKTLFDVTNSKSAWYPSSQIDEGAITLSKFSQVSLTFIRAYSQIGVIVITTALSVVISLLMVLSAVYFIFPHWADDLPGIIATSIAIPALLAPLVIGPFTTLLIELNLTLEKVHKLSCTDGLTECLNRRGFFDEAEKHLITTTPTHSGLVGMIDMDDFKTINDKMGHHIGDDVLRTVSDLLMSTINDQGIVGRLGGDEFAIFAFGNRSHMEALGKELEDVISEFSFGEHFTACASFGGVILDHTETIEQALERADNVLYNTKKQRKSDFKHAA